MSIAKDDYRATISVLKKNSKNFVVDRITVTFKELLNCEYTYDKYDFRLSKFENIDVTRRVKGIHFNTIVSAPGGLELSEGLYLSSFFAYQLKEYDKGHLRRPSFYGLINQYIRYEYKMQKCKKNDPVNFNKSIQNIALDHHLIEIHDLKEVDQVSGLYLLVLDNYNLCYAGQSNNIKKEFKFTGESMIIFPEQVLICLEPKIPLEFLYSPNSNET